MCNGGRMAKRKPTQRKRYTDDFRASACLFLESEGYPGTKGALIAVSRKLNVPQTTLHGWYMAKHNPPPTQVRTIKKAEIIEIIRQEIYAALEAAPIQRDIASYRDLITSAAILVDKLQLLEDKPTERVSHEHHLNDSERVKRINELLDTARTRRSGLAPVRTDNDAIH